MCVEAVKGIKDGRKERKILLYSNSILGFKILVTKRFPERVETAAFPRQGFQIYDRFILEQATNSKLILCLGWWA